MHKTKTIKSRKTPTWIFYHLDNHISLIAFMHLALSKKSAILTCFLRELKPVIKREYASSEHMFLSVHEVIKEAIPVSARKADSELQWNKRW